MTLLTNEAALKLDHSICQQNALMAQSLAIERLKQPQVWSLPMLMDHYPALGDDRIKSLFIRHGGYEPKRGVPMCVHLDAVLKVDAILAGKIPA